MKDNKNFLELTYIVVGLSLVVLVLTGSIFLINKSKNATREYGYIGRTPDTIKTMYFSGEGKVNAKPDIAIVSMGVMVQKVKVSDAQNESSRIMNSFIERLKGMDIEAKDIKTENYNIYPQYDWTSGKQVFKGYQVTQNIEVKIRDLDNISDVLGLAGELGLNQVGNLTFDIDNKEELLKEAKIDAIAKAKANAQETANLLGVTLGRIISFDEYKNTPINVYNGGYTAMKSMSVADESVNVEAGSAELTVNINIGYEIQ